LFIGYIRHLLKKSQRIVAKTTRESDKMNESTVSLLLFSFFLLKSRRNVACDSAIITKSTRFEKIAKKIRSSIENCLVPGTSSGRPIGTATRLTTASGVSRSFFLF